MRQKADYNANEPIAKSISLFGIIFGDFLEQVRALLIHYPVSFQYVFALTLFYSLSLYHLTLFPCALAFCNLISFVMTLSSL